MFDEEHFWLIPFTLIIIIIVTLCMPLDTPVKAYDPPREITEPYLGKTVISTARIYPIFATGDVNLDKKIDIIARSDSVLILTTGPDFKEQIYLGRIKNHDDYGMHTKLKIEDINDDELPDLIISDMRGISILDNKDILRRIPLSGEELDRKVKEILERK